MTEIDKLHEYAKRALRDLRAELQANGNIRPLFRCHYTGGGTQDLKLPPGTESLMNSGAAKEVLFDYLRKITAAGGIDAWVFGTDAWVGRATEEGAKHADEFPKHTDTGFEKLQRMGWVVVEQALLLTLQSPDEVLLIKQHYVRDEERRKIEWLGPPVEDRIPQSKFNGRQKMWGASRDDITGFDHTRKDAGKVGVERLMK